MCTRCGKVIPPGDYVLLGGDFTYRTPICSCQQGAIDAMLERMKNLPGKLEMEKDKKVCKIKTHKVVYDSEQGNHYSDARSMVVAEEIKNATGNTFHWVSNMLVINHIRGAISKGEIDHESVIFTFMGLPDQKADSDGRLAMWPTRDVWEESLEKILMSREQYAKRKE